MSNWRFGLLGPMTVECDGAVRKVPHGRQRAVLTALLLRPGDVTAAQSLLDDIWGSGADRSVLNVSVMRLRRSLGDRSVLEADGDGYRIAVAEDAVDLHLFRRLCREAAETTDRGRQRTLLHDALALWRGEAFSDVEPTDAHSDLLPILDEERLNALEQRVSADLDAGATTELVPELRDLVKAQPFREHFWWQLMLALYRSGRKPEALDTFNAARSSFVDELGVEPGPALRELQQSLLNDDLSALTPSAVTGRAPETSSTGPSYVPLVPAQLPPFNAGFSGRRTELARLDGLMAAERAPIALITGPPGVGKTALAVHWAARSRRRYPDGQLYINLHGYARESPMRSVEALAHLLRTTGLPADKIPTDTAAAASLYRSVTAGKRILVLLDNACDVDQVRPLLPGGQDCFVVVTSRDRLTGLVARDGADRLVVDTLIDSDAQSLLDEVIGADRLAHEPEASHELIRACGNLPLALRIAAAHVTDRPDRSIRDHAEDLRKEPRLDALTIQGDEQSAVRAAFRSSYVRQPEQVRRVFALLGLFPGAEITPDIVAALAGCPRTEAQRTLDRLCAAHLITLRANRRFVLHDLIRLYAVELADRELDTDGRTAAIDAIHLFYAHAVEAATQRLFPYILRLPAPTAPSHVTIEFGADSEAVAWLDTEWDNLVTVIESAAHNGSELAGCRIGAALRGYLLTRTRVVDWLTIARANLTAARELGDQRLQAAAHLSLGDFHRLKSEIRTGINHYERVLVLSRHDGWIEGQAAAHNNLSNLLYPQGKLQAAAEHLTHALELNHRAGRVAAHAANLTNLGGIQLQMGRLDEAITSLRQGARAHRDVGSHAGESHSLTTLGEAFTAYGDYDRAEEALLRAMTLQQELGDQQHLPHALAYLSAVHLETNDHARASDLAVIAIEKAREADNAHDAEATAVRVLGSIDRAAGRHERALRRYNQALELSRTAGGLDYTYTAVLIDLAAAYLDLDDTGSARHRAEQAASLCRAAGYAGLLDRASAVRQRC